MIDHGFKLFKVCHKRRTDEVGINMDGLMRLKNVTVVVKHEEKLGSKSRNLKLVIFKKQQLLVVSKLEL